MVVRIEVSTVFHVVCHSFISGGPHALSGLAGRLDWVDENITYDAYTHLLDGS